MKIKAVLFDLDGTLRDTAETINAAIKHALHKLDVGEVTDDELADYMHHHSHVHQRFAPHVSLEEFEAIFHEKLFELLPQVELYEQALPTLKVLHGAGMQMAIVSSARVAEIQSFLQRVGASEYFQVIIGDDSTQQRKPSPAPVRAALDGLGVLPEECIMVGDMRVDMQAALAADVPVRIGVTTGFESASQLRDAGATQIIDDLSALPDAINRVE